MPSRNLSLAAFLLISLTFVVVDAQPQRGEPNPLFPIEQNKRWGFIDRLGKIVVEPQFEETGEFSEGLAAVKLDGKWGFVDPTGKIIVKPQYSGAYEFSEGLARVQVGGDKYRMYGKWGFIDQSGRTVIEPQYGELHGVAEASYGFHEGLAMIEVDYMKGFIDHTGRVVITPQFQYGYHFSEGLACVSKGLDQKWGYIDKSGRWVIPPQFDNAGSFYEGLASVTLASLCAYIDRTGRVVLKPGFEHENDCRVVDGDFNDGLSRWKIGNKYGYIDKAGKAVIKPDFDLTFNFSEGMAFVMKDGKYGFINQTGQMVIEPQFYHAKDFHNGLARVFYGARESWGYINRVGELVWKTVPETPRTNEATSFIQAGHTRDLLFVGWSPDGNLLASYSGGDGWIKIWNAKSGKLFWDIEARFLTPDGPLKSSDGNLLASGTKDVSYEIRDARSGKLIWNIQAHGTSDERVTSPDGSMIAERGRYGDASVKLFDAKTNQLIRRFEGHPGIVYALAYSPDGKLIASGSGDQTIRFWDAQTGQLLSTLFGHTRKVTAIAFSADSQKLVSGSADDTLKIWDVRNRRILHSVAAFGSSLRGVTSVGFSPDGKTVMAGCGTQIKVWDVETGKLVRTLETHESHTSGDPGGMQMTWCCGSEVRSVVISQDGALIVSAHEDGTIKLWDQKSADPIRIIKGRFADLRAIALSPDAKTMYAGYGREGSIDMWSVPDGHWIRGFGRSSTYVRSLALSPDGKTLVSGHLATDIMVWNVETGESLSEFKQPFSENDQVAFSPDGKTVVSGGENQNILLWEVSTGKLLWSVIPIDSEAERQAEEEAKKEYKIRAALRVEQERKTREADKEAAAWEKLVIITFEHFGEPLNPLEQHMMEKGDRQKSLVAQPAAEATGAWLRLRNNSPQPISFRTDSFYLPRPNCGVRLSNGASGPGLCDGMEVSIQYQVEDANGKPVPFGIDVSSTVVLPPGASVLFSAPRAHLEKGRLIFISYSYLKENEKHELEEYGKAHRVTIRGSDLPNKND